jgi:hypothetical protein
MSAAPLAASVVVGACPHFAAITRPRPFGLPAGMLVEIAMEGEAPHVARWDAFVRDNSDDEGASELDFLQIAIVLSIGGTWRGGGGASPLWEVRRAR